MRAPTTLASAVVIATIVLASTGQDTLGNIFKKLGHDIAKDSKKVVNAAATVASAPATLTGKALNKLGAHDVGKGLEKAGSAEKKGVNDAGQLVGDAAQGKVSKAIDKAA